MAMRSVAGRDLADGLASVLAFGSLPRGRRWWVTLSAGLAAGAGIWASGSLTAER